MKVPFFELKRLYLEQKSELDAAIAGVLESGWYILGACGEKFEAAFGESLGGSVALGCNSGTDALVLALLAAGVGPGDEVIAPSHTAIPTIVAIRATGAEPVFADVDAATWVLTASEVERLLTPKTKAVIAVHLYGNMADVPGIAATLKKRGRDEVALIEDVAQAQGSRLDGHEAGTLGRFGTFSFYPSKNIGALGDGGAVFAAASADREAVRMLRNYGQSGRYLAERAHGMNSRLDELQAAVLSVRLGRLSEWNRRKAVQTARYRTEFAKLPLTFQSVTPACAPAWHLCVIALESRPKRDKLVEQLKADGIDTIIHYPNPTHTQGALAGERRASLPVTESLAGRIVSLPMNAVLTPREQDHVIARLRAFFE